MIPGTIGHYEVIEEIGAGGMGVVYKARDTHLDRFIALKVLPPEKVADPARKARFVQEAKAASALNHPNIVTIHDISSENGVDFMVMEYVEGSTLEQLIPRKGMRVGEVLKLAVQMADALARAHGAGIIHRDLKPANVMVDGHGAVKVLDFGLAKLSEQVVSEDDATVTLGVRTEEGTVVGTAAHMSPEQAEGRPVDARSDIFSFGSMLYEMATGQKPFQGDSKLSVLAAILHEDPKPASEVSAGVPRDLERIISRCLRKDLDRRFQTMGDLRAALLELKEESDSGHLSAAETSMKPRRVQRVTMWGGGAAVLALAAVGGWFVTRDSSRREPLPRPAPLTSMPGFEQHPDLSPDGNVVAFSWDGQKQDNFDIYVQQIGGGDPHRLTTDPKSDIYPGFSPDGRFIVFGRGTAYDWEIIVIPSLGGRERRIGDLRFTVPYVTWSPDGRALVYPDRESEDQPFSLFLHTIDTGERRKIVDPPAGSFGDSGGQISPDGRWLLLRRNTAYWSGDLHRLPLKDGYVADGEPERLTSQNRNFADLAWMSNSREVVFLSGTAGAMSAWRLEAGSSEAPEALFGGADFDAFALSSSSRRMVLSRSHLDTNIWRLNLATGHSELFIDSTAVDDSPRYSRTGRNVSFISARSGVGEIWVADSEGKNELRMTETGRIGPGIGWAPDESKLVFCANIRDLWELFTISPLGGKPARFETGSEGSTTAPHWSRNGEFIFYQANGNIWRTAVRGGTPKQVTRKGGYRGIESHDGKHLHYAKRYFGRRMIWAADAGGLWRVPAEGGEEELVLSDLWMWCDFDVAPGGIYYVPAGGPGYYRLMYHDFLTRKTREILKLPKPPLGGISLSPDGRYLLYTMHEQAGADLLLVENFK